MREFSGKKHGFYQDRLYVYMKKWFVATAACALGYHPNDVAMGLVHAEEGIGKSFFFNFIVPKPLHNMIADPSENGKFNLQESFARFFLVYFDELIGITRKNEDEFKKALTALTKSMFIFHGSHNLSAGKESAAPVLLPTVHQKKAAF